MRLGYYNAGIGIGIKPAGQPGKERCLRLDCSVQLCLCWPQVYWSSEAIWLYAGATVQRSCACCCGSNGRVSCQRKDSRGFLPARGLGGAGLLGGARSDGEGGDEGGRDQVVACSPGLRQRSELAGSQLFTFRPHVRLGRGGVAARGTAVGAAQRSYFRDIDTRDPVGPAGWEWSLP